MVARLNRSGDELGEYRRRERISNVAPPNSPISKRVRAIRTVALATMVRNGQLELRMIRCTSR